MSEHDGETPWPRINSLVWLRLPCCRRSVHPSRVEDVDGQRVVLAKPAQPHFNPVPPPKDDVIFTTGWWAGQGSAEVPSKFIVEEDEPLPIWVVQAVGPVELVQRRRYVRVEWRDEKAHLFLPNLSGGVEADVMDLSEGGMRCAISDEVNEPLHKTFEVAFELDETPLILIADIAWWGDAHGGKRQLGLQFLSPDSATADRIRAFTFSAQLEQRRRERE